MARLVQVYAEYPQLRQLSDYMMLAVNLEYRDLADQRPLSPDDEVALIPPIGYRSACTPTGPLF